MSTQAAASVVAEIRSLVGAWNHPEQLVEKLRLEVRPRRDALLALHDRTVIWDPSLPSDEASKLLARACARYIVRVSEPRCSEDELTDAILIASQRARALPRCAARARTGGVCAS